MAVNPEQMVLEFLKTARAEDYRRPFGEGDVSRKPPGATRVQAYSQPQPSTATTLDTTAGQRTLPPPPA